MCHHRESTDGRETPVREELRVRREEGGEAPEPRTDHAEPDVPTADD